MPRPTTDSQLLSRQIMVLWTGLLVLSCRGQPSTEPPIRIVRDMVHQPKALTYSVESQRAISGANAVPPDTVAVEQADVVGSSAYASNSGYVKQPPFEIDVTVLARGRQRFNIYCSPCHDEAGSGHGIIAQRGFPSPVDLSAPSAVQMADGQIFEAITKGIRNMPVPSEQIEVRDRWSIVAWVRVLQRSHHAKLADATNLVPAAPSGPTAP